MTKWEDVFMKKLVSDPFFIIQAITVGILAFILNLGLSGYQGLTVWVGTLLVLVFARIGGMIWARRLVAIFVVLYLIILFTPITNLTAGLFSVDCSNPIGDAIVVLEGDPGYSRILRGLELFANGSAPMIIVTGKGERHARWNHYGIASLFGVDEDQLLFMEVSSSGTKAEADAILRGVCNRTFPRIVLVTSRIHSLRATRVFEKAGFEVCSAPAPDRHSFSDFSDPWGRILMVRDIVHEALGFIYYKVRDWV